MTAKDPYKVIKHQHVTEKAQMLHELKNNKSNRSVRRCESPKYVFVVDSDATKQQIAAALEQIYKDKGLRVVKVNTLNVKPKPRRVRGRSGCTTGFKKAVVTLEIGDSLDNV